MRRILICFVLTATLVTASWYTVGENITAGDRSYTVGYASDRVVFQGKDRSVVVDEGKCEQHGWYEFCFSQVQDDVSDERVEFVNGSMLEAVRVSIDERGPDLSLTRSVNRSLRVGQTSMVNVTVENSGSVGTEFTYTDSYPDTVWINGVQEHRFVHRAGISPDSTQSFTYNFTPIDSVNRTDTANATYMYSGVERTVNDTVRFVTEEPFDLSISAPIHNGSLGDRVSVNVSLTPERNVSHRFSFDSNMRLVSGKEVYTGRGNATVQYLSTYKKGPGVQFVNMTATVNDDGNRYTERFATSTNVSVDPLVVNASVTPSVVNGGDVVRVKASWPPRFNVTRSTVEAFEESYEMNGSVRIPTPRVERARNATVTATVTYMIGGYRFTSTDSARVSLRPVPANLSLDVNAPSTVAPGPVTVTARVDNAGVEEEAVLVVGDERFNVSVPENSSVERSVTTPLTDDTRFNVSLRSGNVTLRDTVWVRVEQDRSSSKGFWSFLSWLWYPHLRG